MAIPAALMVVGTVMQIAGNYAANMDQAKREKRTAEFFLTQANFVRDSMFRELAIAEKQYAYRLGSQISAAAKGGADVSVGSVTHTFASTIASKIDELLAIKRKGEIDMELARSRGLNSEELAATLSSSAYNLSQGATIALNNIAKSSDSWARSDSSGKTSIISQPTSYEQYRTNQTLTTMETA